MDKFIVVDNDVDSDTRRRIRHVVIIQIILAQGEWSSAKDSRPILKRCNTRQQQTFVYMGTVYVFDIGSLCIHGKESLKTISFHQKYKKRSHNETDVPHIWKVYNRTIRWDLWSEYNKLEWFCMETFVFDWWRSRQSLTRKGLRIFRFYVMPWKVEREPTIKYCLGGQIDVVHHNTELWTQ